MYAGDNVLKMLYAGHLCTFELNAFAPSDTRTTNSPVVWQHTVKNGATERPPFMANAAGRQFTAVKTFQQKSQNMELL